MHTPGHSPGGICLFDRQAGVLFSGDTLYDSRLFDELPGSDIGSYLKTIARLRLLAGIDWCARVTMTASTGTGSASYAMPTSSAAGKPPH